jgi:hypothetical protein
MVCEVSARFDDSEDFVAEMHVHSTPVCTVDASGAQLVVQGSNKFFDARGLYADVSADSGFLNFDGNADSTADAVKVVIDGSTYDDGAGHGKAVVGLSPADQRGNVAISVEWEITSLKFVPDGSAPLDGGQMQVAVN